MKCDLCQSPAVVHEVTVRSGIKKEVHLCEAHAREMGIVMPGQQPINQVLTQFVIAQAGQSAGAKKARVPAKACGNCGMTFAQFKQTGRVGCPECYTTFEAELDPLIERAQSGGTHHTGKTPRRAGTSVDRQLLIQRLVKELDHAVASEQYEKAAELRDRLTSMDVQLRGTAAGKNRRDESKT